MNACWRLSACLAGAILLSSDAPAQARRQPTGAGGVIIQMDGRRLAEQGVAVPGGTLVPLRGLAQALGGTVHWSAPERRATLVTPQATLVFPLDGAALMFADGQSRPLPLPARIVGGRVMVPPQALEQSFGFQARYDPRARTVFLSRAQQERPTMPTRPGDSILFPSPLEAEVAVSPATVRPGEPVTLTLRARNRTDQPARLQFSSGQQYNFEVVRQETGETVWRWSDGRFFTQALAERTVPAGQTVTWQEHWDGRTAAGEPLEPGSYVVRGTVTTREARRPLVGQAPLSVRR